MKPNRIFTLLEQIYNSKTKTQLHPKSAKPLLVEGYIQEVPYEENCSMGKFRCIFHELTDKGNRFYADYKRK